MSRSLRGATSRCSRFGSRSWPQAGACSRQGAQSCTRSTRPPGRSPGSSRRATSCWLLRSPVRSPWSETSRVPWARTCSPWGRGWTAPLARGTARRPGRTDRHGRRPGIRLHVPEWRSGRVRRRHGHRAVALRRVRSACRISGHHVCADPRLHGRAGRGYRRDRVADGSRLHTVALSARERRRRCRLCSPRDRDPCLRCHDR